MIREWFKEALDAMLRRRSQLASAAASVEVTARPATSPPRLADDDHADYLRSVGIECRPARYGSWRCGACSRMQADGTLAVMIEDSIQSGDPMWAVVERHRRCAYNGEFTDWCLKCSRSFGPMTAEEMAKAMQTPHNPIPTIEFKIKKGD